MTTPPPDGSDVNRPHGIGDAAWAVPEPDQPPEHARVNGTLWGGDVAEPFPGTEPAPPPRPPKRPLAMAIAALATLAGAAVLGVPYGFLWAWLAPDPELLKITGGFFPETGLYPVDPQPEDFLAGDGWFMLLGLGFGIAVAVAAWFVAKRYRGPILLAALVVGAVGGGVIAYWIGHSLGLDAYRQAVAQAAEGDHLIEPSSVRAYGLGTWFGVIPRVQGVLLAEAIGAAVAYTLLAGWSRYPSLRPPAPSPADLMPWEAPWPPVSSGPAGQPAGTGAPAPPGPDEAGPPRV